jgi:hypothetical protein
LGANTLNEFTNENAKAVDHGNRQSIKPAKITASTETLSRPPSLIIL